MKARKGFTLVEILIVVVILGILAAIVIPQFTEASTEAKTSSLCTDLQTVRSQIELYKIQHNDDMPGTVAGVTFEQALTQKTDQAGNLDASGQYGPYLQKIPSNPFAASDVANTVATGPEDAAVSDAAGWYFETDTGEFNAVDSAEHLAL